MTTRVARQHLVAVVAVAAAHLIGCGPGPEAPAVCPAPSARARDGVDPAHLLSFVVGDDVRVQGLSGAAPPGARVELGDATLTADDAGAFDVVSSSAGASPTLAVDDVEIALTPRRTDDALACAVSEPVSTGTLPNDVVIVTCDGRVHAAVALSAEGAIDVVDATGVRRDPRPVFAVEEGVGAQPFQLALVDEGPLAVVTLFAWHAVALVDLCAGRVLDTARVVDDAGAPVRFAVDPPLTLPGPVDADLDGASETVVARAVALHPQALAVSGAGVVVAFTGHLWPATDDTDQILAPGVLARFSVVDDALVLEGARAIEGARNPQAVVALDDGFVVSLSGPFARGGATAVADDGAIAFVDDDGAPVRTLGAGRFAPARPAVVDGRLVVGSLLSPRIAIVEETAASLDDAVVVTVPGRAVSSLFDAAPLGGGLVVVTDFTEDRLHLVDAARGVALSWPFVEGLPVAPASEVFRGALAVDVVGDAPGRATAAVLLGLSSEVVFVDLAGVFGP